jgi:hypothetical protein
LLIAGILRVARSFRKIGVEPGAKLRSALAENHLEILIEGFSELQPAPKGLAIGRQMLESALGKTISIRPLETSLPSLPLQFPSANPPAEKTKEEKLLAGD